MKNKLYICFTSKVRMWKLQIYHFLFKLKRHNSVIIHRTRTKFTLDLYLLVNNLHMKYQFYICIPSKVSKNWEFPIFLKFSRGITLSEIIWPKLNSNSAFMFIRYIHISNLSWMCAMVVVIMIGKWMMTEYPKDRKIEEWKDGKMEEWKDRKMEQGNTICPSYFMVGAKKCASSTSSVCLFSNP